MILYHGSEKIIDAPEFGKGNSHNDYGRGFYCTENEELAKEWACSNNNNGFANKYEFDMDGLNVLYLNSENYNLLNWLAVLTKRRTYWENNTVSEMAKKYLAENFMIDTSGFDVIIGYRADDSYFSFAQDFVAGAISYRQLGEAMRLGKLGEQIVLMSEKAFERIKYISNSPADASIYYKKKKERDREFVRDIHGKDGCYPTNGRELGKETPLGDGKVNYPQFISRLKELGYNDTITIEREISGDKQISDIKNAKEYLNSLIN